MSADCQPRTSDLVGSGVADLCGGPPDVVVECVGLPGMMYASLRHVRRRGRVVVTGACMTPDAVLPAMTWLKEVELRFVVAYARADFALALRLLAGGRIPGPAMVTGHVGLDGFPRAFEALRAPGAQRKVILQPCVRQRRALGHWSSASAGRRAAAQ